MVEVGTACQACLMFIIITLSVLGNLLVVCSVLCFPALRQPPNLLLLGQQNNIIHVNALSAKTQQKSTREYAPRHNFTPGHHLGPAVYWTGAALAVTDLLVSLLVMPGALLQQLVGEWPANDLLCRAWVTADVFLCTSSILSLTAICIGGSPQLSN